MPELPLPVKRLDSFFAASSLAHMSISDMRRDLVAQGRGSEEIDDLLSESARITLTE